MSESNIKKPDNSSLKPETGSISATDVIYRQAAIDAVWEVSKILPTMAIRAKAALEKLPSAEQERKPGKLTKFCPNCGADMRGDEGNNAAQNHSLQGLP